MRNIDLTKLVARGILPKSERPKMNGLETEYGQYLELLKRAGEILWYRYECIRLRLADGTFFTVDWFVLTKNLELQAHETKGFMREAARVRLNVAAEEYPFTFFLVKKGPKGTWNVTEV